jgi:hypothetical protein
MAYYVLGLICMFVVAFGQTVEVGNSWRVLWVLAFPSALFLFAGVESGFKSSLRTLIPFLICNLLGLLAGIIYLHFH